MVRVENPIFIKKIVHTLLKEETLQLVVLNASGKLFHKHGILLEKRSLKKFRPDSTDFQFITCV